MDNIEWIVTVLGGVLIIMMGVVKIFNNRIKPECQKNFSSLWEAWRSMDRKREQTEKDVLVLENHFNTIIEKLDKIDDRLIKQDKK